MTPEKGWLNNGILGRAVVGPVRGLEAVALESSTGASAAESPRNQLARHRAGEG